MLQDSAAIVRLGYAFLRYLLGMGSHLCTLSFVSESRQLQLSINADLQDPHIPTHTLYCRIVSTIYTYVYVKKGRTRQGKGNILAEKHPCIKKKTVEDQPVCVYLYINILSKYILFYYGASIV